MITPLRQYTLEEAQKFLDENADNYLYRHDYYDALWLYTDVRKRVGCITPQVFSELKGTLARTCTIGDAEYYRSTAALYAELEVSMSEPSNLAKVAETIAEGEAEAREIIMEHGEDNFIVGNEQYTHEL